VQENLNKLLPEIYKQVEEESPKEACGLVVEIKNELKYNRPKTMG
jgi:proteasome lid subunit RPN8/RPN11